MSSMPVAAFQPTLSRRAVAAATIGNALEFYDFITFVFFAVQIGRAFFPTGDAFASLMASLATFGAGFITRPIGAYVLGGFADRVGRKPAMLLSFTLMGGAITVLALTPSYAAIGWAAPVIAICARLTQGFALGGEIGASTTYMLEAAAVNRRGFMISWQSASQNIAATVGSFVGLALSVTLSAAALEAYGWRIALLLGALTVPFGLAVRNGLPETLHVEEEASAVSTHAGRLRPHARVIVLGLVIIAAGTIGTYIFNYMATYGQATLHLSAPVSLGAEVANNGIGVVTTLIGGWYCDRHGRRPWMIWPMALFALSILPTFLWLTSARDAVSFIGGNLILSAISGFVWGPFYAALAESLPKDVRTRVFAVVYSVAVAVFGGSTQLVITWLIHVTGSPLAPAWYLTGVTVIGLGAMTLFPESAPARRLPSAALEAPLASG